MDDEQFDSLLDQVRDLHRRTDEITREQNRLREYVRAQLSWGSAPSLPRAQRDLADEVVAALSTPRLSNAQSRALYRAFFGR